MFGERQLAGNGHLWISGEISEAWAMSGLVSWIVLRDRFPMVYLRNSSHYPGVGKVAIDQVDFLSSAAVRAHGGRSLRHLLGDAAGPQRAQVLATLDAIAEERPEQVGEATRLVTFLGTTKAVAEAERVHRQLALPGTPRISPAAPGIERLTVELASPAQIPLIVSSGVRPELPAEVELEIGQVIAQQLLRAGLDPEGAEGRSAERVLRSDLEVERAIALAAARGEGDRGLTQATILDLVADQHPQPVAALRLRISGEVPCPYWWSSPFQVVDVGVESQARLGLLLEDVLINAARRHSQTELLGPMVLLIEPGLLRSEPAIAELEQLLRLGRRYGLHVVVVAGAELAHSSLAEHCAARIYDQRKAPGTDSAAAAPWLTIPSLAINRPLTSEEVHPDLLAKGRHAVASAAFPVPVFLRSADVL